MTNVNWESILNQLNDEFIEEAVLSYEQPVSAAPCEKETNMNHKVRKTSKRLLLVAVVATMTMVLAIGGVAAYMLGIDALLRPDKTEFDGKTYEEVSLTQPQDWDENALDASIVEKLENNKKAWAEWADYKADNPDKEIIITAEEYEETVAYDEIMTKGYGEYDFNYGINSAAEALKLEEIADKYGLKLRGNQNAAFSSEITGQTGAQFFTNAQLAAKTAEVGCRENLFTETPVGFDKMYWFDEGTFCVSYYVNLPSSGKQVTCYGYNSCYGTLSSGAEVYNWEVDTSGFDSRNYTTADDTEVTILSNGTSAYIY
ncbi:MAG: hypothetical protein IIV43_04345, partial [Oscillospiraceae bacterium]|nr:hypothetical protein [Oscillospiraceae bacterium]